MGQGVKAKNRFSQGCRGFGQFCLHLFLLCEFVLKNLAISYLEEDHEEGEKKTCDKFSKLVFLRFDRCVPLDAR